MRKSAVTYVTGNSRNLLQFIYTTTYIRTAAPSFLLLVCTVSTTLTPARKALLQRRPTLFLCIYTLTQPLLPLRADSACFHRASIAVRLSRCNSTSHSPSTCLHSNLHPSSSSRQRDRAWTACLLSSSHPSSSSKHLASLTPARANDPLIICAAHRRTLLQPSIH